MRKALWMGVFLLVVAIAPSLALADGSYTFFGSASYVSPGYNSNRAVLLTSDANANPQLFSGIDFTFPSGMLLSSLSTLSTYYDFTASTCGQGSPRFAISLAAYPNATIFVYIVSPSNQNCTENAWINTGNLLDGSVYTDNVEPHGFYDWTGPLYNTWADVVKQYGSQTVSDIFLVSDAGPSGSQTVQIDNTYVNTTLYSYEPTKISDCKNGGWQTFTFAPGPFKNEGACVSYFAKQPR